MIDDRTSDSDWDRWRGGVDATQKAFVDRLESGMGDLSTHLAALHIEMTQGFTDIKARQDYTNGHVRELREWKASVQGQEVGERRVEVRVQQAESTGREAKTARQYRTSTLVGWGIGIAGVAATIATALVSLVH